MAQSKKAELAALVGDCQRAYDLFIDMSSRTHAALLEALCPIYLLIYLIRQDFNLHAAYLEELREQKIAVGPNETLQVVKYVLFRYVFHSRGNHKSEINKAITYANACKAALADGVRPQDFLKYVKQPGGLSRFSSTKTTAKSGKAKRTKMAQIDKSELQGATKQASSHDLSFPVPITCANTKVQERVAALTRELTAPTSLVLEARWDGTRTIVTRSRVSHPFRPLSVPPFQQAQQRTMGPEVPTSKPSAPRGKGPPLGTPKAKSGQVPHRVHRLARAPWQR